MVKLNHDFDKTTNNLSIKFHKKTIMQQQAMQTLLLSVIDYWEQSTPVYWYISMIGMAVILLFSITKIILIFSNRKLKNNSAMTSLITSGIFIFLTMQIGKNYYNRPNLNVFFCHKVEKAFNIKITNERSCVFTKDDYRTYKVNGIEKLAIMKYNRIMEDNKIENQ